MSGEWLLEALFGLSFLILEGLNLGYKGRYPWLGYGLVVISYCFQLVLLFFITIGLLAAVSASITKPERISVLLALLLLVVTALWAYRCWRLTKRIWQATKDMLGRRK